MNSTSSALIVSVSLSVPLSVIFSFTVYSNVLFKSHPSDSPFRSRDESTVRQTGCFVSAAIMENTGSESRRVPRTEFRRFPDSGTWQRRGQGRPSAAITRRRFFPVEWNARRIRSARGIIFADRAREFHVEKRTIYWVYSWVPINLCRRRVRNRGFLSSSIKRERERERESVSTLFASYRSLFSPNGRHHRREIRTNEGEPKIERRRRNWGKVVSLSKSVLPCFWWSLHRWDCKVLDKSCNFIYFVDGGEGLCVWGGAKA